MLPIHVIMHHPGGRFSRRRALGLAAGALAVPMLAACGGDSGSGDGFFLNAALDGLEPQARDLMARTGVPGLAMAVVQGGRTLHAAGLGVRRLGMGDAVDADTVFQLASVSKSVGATVVARQVDRGLLAWDAPMRQLLPWFALGDEAVNAQLTPADLYAHRSGLPDHAGDLLEDLGYGQRECLERLRLLPLAPFRQSYAYTNFGLTAAAEGVAAAAGVDWATLSDRSLYQPLGMRRTSSRYADFRARDNRADNHRQVDGTWAAGPPRDPDAQSPAGGVSSCVNDMARWLSMLLGKGVHGGQRLMAAGALETLWQPQMESGPGYGLGFNTGTTLGGHPVYSHSGAFALGASTCFMVLPAADTAIVVLTNGAPIGVPETLCQQFTDVLESGGVRRDWWSLYSEAFAGLTAPAGSLAGAAPPPQPVPPGSPLSAYAGTWRNQYHGPLQTWLAGDELRMTLGPAGAVSALRHWDGETFVFAPAGENAPPGSMSQAVFGAGRVTLEFYDGEGLGTFVRDGA